MSSIALLHHSQRQFLSQTELTDTGRLTCQLALRILYLCIPRLELQVGCLSYPTFPWVSVNPVSSGFHVCVAITLTAELSSQTIWLFFQEILNTSLLNIFSSKYSVTWKYYATYFLLGSLNARCSSKVIWFVAQTGKVHLLLKYVYIKHNTADHLFKKRTGGSLRLASCHSIFMFSERLCFKEVRWRVI